MTAGRQAWLKHTKAQLELHHRSFFFIHNQIVQKMIFFHMYVYIEKESKQHSVLFFFQFVFPFCFCLFLDVKNTNMSAEQHNLAILDQKEKLFGKNEQQEIFTI